MAANTICHGYLRAMASIHLIDILESAVIEIPSTHPILLCFFWRFDVAREIRYVDYDVQDHETTQDDSEK